MAVEVPGGHVGDVLIDHMRICPGRGRDGMEADSSGIAVNRVEDFGEADIEVPQQSRFPVRPHALADQAFNEANLLLYMQVSWLINK